MKSFTLWFASRDLLCWFKVSGTSLKFPKYLHEVATDARRYQELVTKLNKVLEEAHAIEMHVLENLDRGLTRFAEDAPFDLFQLRDIVMYADKMYEVVGSRGEQWELKRLDELFTLKAYTYADPVAIDTAYGVAITVLCAHDTFEDPLRRYLYAKALYSEHRMHATELRVHETEVRLQMAGNADKVQHALVMRILKHYTQLTINKRVTGYQFVEYPVMPPAFMKAKTGMRSYLKSKFRCGERARIETQKDISVLDVSLKQLKKGWGTIPRFPPLQMGADGMVILEWRFGHWKMTRHFLNTTPPAP